MIPFSFRLKLYTGLAEHDLHPAPGRWQNPSRYVSSGSCSRGASNLCMSSLTSKTRRPASCIDSSRRSRHDVGHLESCVFGRSLLILPWHSCCRPASGVCATTLCTLHYGLCESVGPPLYRVNTSEALNHAEGCTALALGKTVYAKQPRMDSVESRSSYQSRAWSEFSYLWRSRSPIEKRSVKAPCPPSSASLPPQLRQKCLPIVASKLRKMHRNGKPQN